MLVYLKLLTQTPDHPHCLGGFTELHIRVLPCYRRPTELCFYRHFITIVQVVLSSDGTAARMISKYRPPCPIVVVSDSNRVLRGLSGYYGIYPCKVRGGNGGTRCVCVTLLTDLVQTLSEVTQIC